MIQNYGLSCFTRNFYFYLTAIVIQSHAIKGTIRNHYCCGRSFSCDRDHGSCGSIFDITWLIRRSAFKELIRFSRVITYYYVLNQYIYSVQVFLFTPGFADLPVGPSNFLEHLNLILSWCDSHGATFWIKDQTVITMPGYPVPEVDKEIFQELLCEYCDTVIRDAWRAECGHFYCRSCVEFLFR